MTVKHLFGKGWEIIPAGGATGEAFFATNHTEKLFLKRNSSPFLAVLSAEGIVPKLFWTKRMENGDVITAQHFLNGRELESQEMAQGRVAKLLKKIHESRPLLSMLERLGKVAYKPEIMLADVMSLKDDVLVDESIQQAIQFLQSELPHVQHDRWTVCHGDVNHNNWLLSDNDEIYLIDWDGATIADPALDLGPLLYWYVPKNEWVRWLEQYGCELTDDLRLRMKWYVLAHTIISIEWHESKSRFQEMNFWLTYLQKLLHADKN